MKVKAAIVLLLVGASSCECIASITADISGVKPGPIAVSSTEHALQVRWRDQAAHQWETTFSLDSSNPLITAITVDGKTVVERANPVYRCATGKRSGGWDNFFDFPPANHAGTRSFIPQVPSLARWAIEWKSPLTV
jgi:hypothetical protein